MTKSLGKRAFSDSLLEPLRFRLSANIVTKQENSLLNRLELGLGYFGFARVGILLDDLLE